jgi:serine/threonine-protein kinase
VGDTSALEPGTVIAGRYRVASKIGHGGMGAVYHVHHVHTDESLALKVLHPEVLRDASVVERFRREARAPARITSEHIARVTDADTAADLDGAPFYVMELLRGRDLERILKQDGPIPPALVVEYLRQTARALDKAHAMGIVHRDLKPENLFLTHREDGTPCIKLLDFGIARLADTDGPAMATQVGHVFGTPNYMAPEQATGSAELIGPATDIWALGLVAFKLLVGHEYFTAKTSAHLYAQILSEPMAAPSVRGSVYGPAFDAWFVRCVARKIEERYASAADAVAGLAAALDVPSGRYTSAPSFSDLGRTSIDTSPQAERRPDLARAAEPPPAVGPPTELPAGLPASTSRRNALFIAGGALGVFAVIVLIYGIHSSSRPASYGLVATSAAASASGSNSALSASTELATATPSASAASTAPADTKRSTPPTKPPPTKDVSLSREQKKRLDALERLCSQRTYTPAECQSKRQAIIHGGT